MQPSQPQILTVNVEDYFHVWAIRSSDAVRRKHWDRLDPRLDASLTTTLKLLATHGAKATFFVFGCIADSSPELVERIMAGGHEVGSRGYLPRGLGNVDRSEFVDDLGRARLALERAGSNKILGYRSPVWISERHLWMLDALAEAGYVYDSSVNPILRRFSNHQEYFHAQNVTTDHGTIWEYPIETAGLLGFRVAVSGGNYIRQLPHKVLSRVVTHRIASGRSPIVFYFSPWELDVEQPHIAGLSMASSLRQYRGLAKTRWVLDTYLRRYRFTGIADHLSLPHPPLPADERPPPLPDAPLDSVPPPSGVRKEVTLVVPLFNEESNVGYLFRTLSAFRRSLARTYRMHLILVDDRSTDDTWQQLNEVFGREPDTMVVRHERNRGVAAAILTGIRAATTDIVCSIDCDCSYDPSDLARMLPMIEGADLVTASPYHPDGKVMNVPSWRLFLSRSLSSMYSALLRERFYTYTSCCRVYRREAVNDITLTNEGFLGVAETLIELKRRGGRVVECPATLESRLLGESKMKVARTIGRHLGMLARLSMEQANGTAPTPMTSGSTERRP